MFRLRNVPIFVFIGVYIQLEGSRYFDPKLFAELTSFLVDCQEKRMTPIVGGDFNSRIGKPEDIDKSCHWQYNKNLDSVTNKHGRTFFRDLCRVGAVMPINCLKYGRKEIDNNFTFLWW